MKFRLALFALLVAACGANSTSQTKDISTPGPVDADNTIVWHDDGVLYFGDCPRGELPSREICPAEFSLLYSVVVERFERSYANDRDRLDAEEAAEIRRLRNNHPVVVHLRSRIADLTSGIAGLDDDIAAIDRRIAGQDSAIADLNTQIQDYDHQIGLVDGRLADDPNNQDLLTLRGQLIAERNVLIANRSSHESARAALLVDRSAKEQEKAELESDRAESERELAARLQDLEVESDTLDRIRADRGALLIEEDNVERVLNLILDSNIVYRYNSLTSTDKKVFTRLYGFRASENIELRGGILMVRHNNVWRGVCDDGFDANDGRVACRMLGQDYVTHASGNGSSDSFWLDDLACNGTEDSLFECSHGGIGNENCSAGEHIRLTCR